MTKQKQQSNIDKEEENFERKQFSVLKILEKAEKPIWKKEIHRRIGEELDCLPVEKRFSVQTVGRRVNRMKEENLVKALHINDDEVNRPLIEGFFPTEKGRKVIRAQREHYLKQKLEDYLQNSLEAEEEEFTKEVFSNFFSVPKKVCSERSNKDLVRAFLLYEYEKSFEDSSKEGFKDFLLEISRHNSVLGQSIGEYIVEE